MKIAPIRLGVTLVIGFFLAAGCAGLRDKIGKTLSTEQPGPVGEEVKSLTLFITAGSLNLRACPGLNCQILTTLKRGEEVIKISQEGEWLKVRVKAGKIEGWVSSRFVSSKPPKPVVPSPHESAPSKPQEEWATPQKEAPPQKEAAPPPALPKEDFAK
ncbi:MAG: SH3 domain-containing protein [Pseudomonadota bacterium]